MYITKLFPDNNIFQRIGGICGFFDDNIPIDNAVFKVIFAEFLPNIRSFGRLRWELDLDIGLRGVPIVDEPVVDILRIGDGVFIGFGLIDDLAIILNGNGARAKVRRQPVPEQADLCSGVLIVVQERPPAAVFCVRATGNGHVKRDPTRLGDGDVADELLQVGHPILDDRVAQIYLRVAQGQGIVDSVTHFQRLAVDVHTILGHGLVDGIIAKVNRILGLVGLLSAVAGILDVSNVIDIVTVGSIRIDHLCFVGDDHRAIARIGGHVKIEQLHIIGRILPIIRVRDGAGNVIGQLHLTAVADTDHDVALQHLEVGHDVPDVYAGHVGVLVTNGQGIVDLRSGLKGAFGSFFDVVMRLLFIGNFGRFIVLGILTVFLRNVVNVGFTVDAVLFGGFPVDQLDPISDRHGAIARSSFREGVIEQGHHVLAVIGVCDIAAKVNIISLSIVGYLNLTLRNDHVRHGIGDSETGKLGVFIAVGDAVGYEIFRRTGSARSTHFNNRDGFLGLFELNAGFAAGHIFCAIDIPRDLIGLGSLVAFHDLELFLGHLRIVGHLIAAFGHAGGAQRGCHIEREVLRTTCLDVGDRPAVNLHAGGNQRLQAAQGIVERHGVQIGIDVDIGCVVQRIAAVAVLLFRDVLAAFFNVFLVVDRDFVRGAGEFECILPIITDLGFYRLNRNVKGTYKRAPAIEIAGIGKGQDGLAVSDHIVAQLSGTDGNNAIAAILDFNGELRFKGRQIILYHRISFI